MPYHKNIAFTSLVKIHGRLREFNFRKRNESLYDGDTSDERGERHLFNVEKAGEHWTLKGTLLPSWLTQHEANIIEAVQKQEQEILASAAIAPKK